MAEDKKELTYEMVMKMFAETDKKFQETAVRFKEPERLIKANAKQIGGIDRSNGLMAKEFVFNARKKKIRPLLI